jgi:hypothetical protein
MPRLPILAAAAFPALLAAGLFAPSPALAQAGGDGRMNMVIVYGNDPCPQSTGDEITVCARKGEGERYRIPEPLRGSDSPQNEAWTNRVLAYESVGAAGTQSCSATGPGGWTGCASKFINNAYAEKKQTTDVHFSDMIAKEREKRAATVDANAADTQARVEVEEKAYDEAHKAAAANAAANPPAATGK